MVLGPWPTLEEASSGFPPRLPTTPTEAQEVPLVGTPKNSPAYGMFPPTLGRLSVTPYVFESSLDPRCLMKTSNLHILMKTSNLLNISGRQEGSWSFRRRPDGHQVPESLRRTPILELLVQGSF